MDVKPSFCHSHKSYGGLLLQEIFILLSELNAMLSDKAWFAKA